MEKYLKECYLHIIMVKSIKLTFNDDDFAAMKEVLTKNGWTWSDGLLFHIGKTTGDRRYKKTD
jgi:hypothetical protein